MEHITLEEAAARLGITPRDLRTQRRRGLPPGNLGYTRRDAPLGTVWYDPDDLIDVEAFTCDRCGRTYKTAAGYDRHLRDHTEEE